MQKAANSPACPTPLAPCTAGAQLSDNAIVLDAGAVERLKHLTYLEILRLDGNPLALLPDIGRMPRLKVVALKNTGLITWPEGTLAKTRPRGFLLDLRDNPVSVIPDVVAGSPQARHRPRRILVSCQYLTGRDTRKSVVR